MLCFITCYVHVMLYNMLCFITGYVMLYIEHIMLYYITCYVLYNKVSNSCILIGPYLWSIRGQMQDWRHQPKEKNSFFFKMAENFETSENILPDLANKEIEITLVEAVYKFQKEEEEKTRFYVENDLEKILEQSQSLATKRNTKWVVKLFQGNKQFFCFAFK